VIGKTPTLKGPKIKIVFFRTIAGKTRYVAGHIQQNPRVFLANFPSKHNKPMKKAGISTPKIPRNPPSSPSFSNRQVRGLVSAKGLGCAPNRGEGPGTSPQAG
jgi:hypothetical protein